MSRSCCCFTSFFRLSGRSGEGEGETMAGREVVSEERVEQDEAEIGESEEERTCVVGE